MSSQKNFYCRLCAKPKRFEKFVDLQKDTKLLDRTLQKLEHFNAQFVNILGDNSLPRIICFTCYESLNKTHKFLTKVWQAQIVLREILDKNTKENLNDENSQSDDCKNDLYDDTVFMLDAPSDDKKDLDIKDEKDECNKKYLVPVADNSVSNETIKQELKQECDCENLSVPSEQYHVNIEDLNVQDILTAAMGNSQTETEATNIMWYAKELSHVPDEKSWKSYSWICLHCDMEFPDAHVLRSHSKEFHRKCYGFTCVECTVECKTFDAFVDHVRMHRKYLRYRCPYCDATIKKDTSKSHVAQHFLKTQVPCRTCGEILKDEDALQKHNLQYNSHKPIRKPRRKPGEPITVDDLTCQICQKVYKNKNSLRDHQKVHVKDRKRNYTCDRCGKAFFSKGTLTSHIMLHDKNRPHVCKICNKSFLFPHMLRRHVEMHSGVKPYSCEQCGRCFRLKYQLNAHKIIHTDQMPYMCQFCSKSFRFKQILKNHERQHTGAKPYSCDLCKMEFTNWSNYNKHMKRRHGTDTAKKKITPEGVFPVNPETGLIISIEDPVATEEWKSKIMIPGKRGKKKKLLDVIVKS